jgi:hypothetical protein
VKVSNVIFARRVFKIAAIYGIIVLLPQYFMEKKIAIDFPPPLTHPEHFYGFIGIALVWQILFFLIAADPIRYRTLMPVAILEKLAFAVPCFVLYLQGRLSAVILVPGSVDLLLAILFAISYVSTPKETQPLQ